MTRKPILSALVIINFIIYISLGLPDSILGSAWPSMRETYGMGASQISYLTTIILLFSVISSLLYTKIARYFTTSQVIYQHDIGHHWVRVNDDDINSLGPIYINAIYGDWTRCYRRHR